MNITGGSSVVTTYFVLRTAADGTATTGATITDIDLQYVRTGAAPEAKVDAQELAETDSEHADNQAKEIDGTDAPGLYRVDWPDAAFVAGVKQVILSVKLAGSFTEHMAVDIDPPVDVTRIGGTVQTGADVGADVATVDSKVLSAHVVTDAAISVADSKVDSAHVITDSIVISAHVATDADVATVDSKLLSAHVVTDAALSVADSKIDSAHAATDADIATVDSKVLSAHVITDSVVISAHVATDADIATVDSKVLSAHVVTDTALSVADSKIDSAHVVTDADIATVDSKVLSAHVITDSVVVSAHVVSDTALSVADSKVVSAHVLTDSKLISAHVATDADIATVDSKVLSAHVVTDAALSVADSKVVSAHVVTDSKVVSAVGGTVTTLFAKTGITAGGSASFEDMMKAIYAYSRGKISKSSNTYTYYDDDDATGLQELTIGANDRTTA